MERVDAEVVCASLYLGNVRMVDAGFLCEFPGGESLFLAQGAEAGADLLADITYLNYYIGLLALDGLNLFCGQSRCAILALMIFACCAMAVVDIGVIFDAVADYILYTLDTIDACVDIADAYNDIVAAVVYLYAIRAVLANKEVVVHGGEFKGC